MRRSTGRALEREQRVHPVGARWPPPTPYTVSVGKATTPPSRQHAGGPGDALRGRREPVGHGAARCRTTRSMPARSGTTVDRCASGRDARTSPRLAGADLEEHRRAGPSRGRRSPAGGARVEPVRDRRRARCAARGPSEPPAAVDLGAGDVRQVGDRPRPDAAAGSPAPSSRSVQARPTRPPTPCSARFSAASSSASGERSLATRRTRSRRRATRKRSASARATAPVPVATSQTTTGGVAGRPQAGRDLGDRRFGQQLGLGARDERARIGPDPERRATP